jgi:cysteinyl-tRNA synthetase
MADELLWKEPLRQDRLSDKAKSTPHVFDIHGGGLDLQFPHHEDEIAQSCCANGTDEMARYWLHNEMLQVEGKKMSKSLGNFFTVRDLLDQGVPGEVIRFVMLSTHYRKPMDWTEKKRDEAEKTLRKWYRQIGLSTTKLGDDVHDGTLAALADDLNTPDAITNCHALSTGGDVSQLRQSMAFLGLFDGTIPDWARIDGFSDAEAGLIQDLLQRRQTARQSKDFNLADKIRDEMLGAGVLVKDTGAEAHFERLPNFDATKLDRLWADT